MLPREQYPFVMHHDVVWHARTIVICTLIETFNVLSGDEHGFYMTLDNDLLECSVSMHCRLHSWNSHHIDNHKLESLSWVSFLLENTIQI